MANLVDFMEAKSDEHLPNPAKLRKLDEAQKEKYLLQLAKKNVNAKRRFLVWMKNLSTPIEIEEDLYNRIVTELEDRESFASLK